MTISKSLQGATATSTSMASDALHAASQSLERAGEKVRELRMGMSDSAVAAQQRIGRYADITTRYVSEQPLKSALIAAGVGALIAGLIIAARRRRDHH
jgi:ElaB/YqjD/DUF883 family membrane-anchored ribosome-binding protein